MHWHQDVTFCEDANTTLDKKAAQNQNIIREMELEYIENHRTDETRIIHEKNDL